MSAIRGPQLVLKEGRERSLVRGHPWVFSGAVQALRGTAGLGETVRVSRHDGAFLAWAAYNPSSQICARVWDFDEAARDRRRVLRTQDRRGDRAATRSCCRGPTCALAGSSTRSRTGCPD